MNSKILSLLAGASLIAFAGAASAEEPVTLSAVQMDAISAGGGVDFDSNVDKDVDIDVDVDVDIDKDVTVDIDVTDNSAFAEASADAFGENTLAETEAFAQTTDWSSEAFSSAIAVTD
jgi:hypothetical protein